MYACKTQFCMLYVHSYKLIKWSLTTKVLQMLHGGSVGIMATNIQIIPPEKIHYKKLDEWLKWNCWFQHIPSASGLDKEDKARTLLYYLGNEGSRRSYLHEH